jgi:hypothetical protein
MLNRVNVYALIRGAFHDRFHELGNVLFLGGEFGCRFLIFDDDLPIRNCPTVS